MSIIACSRDVSLKSEAVDSSFLRTPPLASGCSSSHNALPSPPAKLESKALFNTFAAFTCLVLAIDLASALV